MRNSVVRNQLRLGDNLVLMRDHSLFPDESVDLIYLDPPPQPHRGELLAAREVKTSHYESLLPGRTNIWRWDAEANAIFEDLQNNAPPRIQSVISALHTMLGPSALFAYFVHTMPLLMECHRVLSHTGSLFYHGDPIANHYVKILLDSLFGQKGLVNEIVWQRIDSHQDIPQNSNHMGRIHDTILFYRKSSEGIYTTQYIQGSDEYLDHYYPHTDYRSGRRYRLGDVTTSKQSQHSNYEWRIKREGPNARWQGDLEDEWQTPVEGWEYRVVPPFKGRYWALPRDLMIRSEEEGLLVYSRTGYPHIKRFFTGGVPVHDIWTDIPPVTGPDRLYPHQKPKGLFERIVLMASKPGDVILDPFCGTAPLMDAVESINRAYPDEEPRSWIGIEASSLALNLCKYRLGRYERPMVRYKTIGDIDDLKHANTFASRHPLEFQYWALGLVQARPLGGNKARLGTDRLVDGIRLFQDQPGAKLLSILCQAKPGNVKQDDVRGLIGFCNRLKAPLGVLISLQDPTKDAIALAESAGTYTVTHTGVEFPRIQLVTVETLLKTPLRTPECPVKLPNRFPGELFK